MSNDPSVPTPPCEGITVQRECGPGEPWDDVQEHCGHAALYEAEKRRAHAWELAYDKAMREKDHVREEAKAAYAALQAEHARLVRERNALSDEALAGAGKE